MSKVASLLTAGEEKRRPGKGKRFYVCSLEKGGEESVGDRGSWSQPDLARRVQKGKGERTAVNDWEHGEEGKKRWSKCNRGPDREEVQEKTESSLKRQSWEKQSQNGKSGPRKSLRLVGEKRRVERKMAQRNEERVDYISKRSRSSTLKLPKRKQARTERLFKIIPRRAESL